VKKEKAVKDYLFPSRVNKKNRAFEGRCRGKGGYSVKRLELPFAADTIWGPSEAYTES